jgi:hypothetical protein
MSAIVLPTLPACDMILGMNFFESFDPIIDWRAKTVQLDPTKFSFPAATSDMIIASFHVTSNTPIRSKTHCKNIVPTPITIVQPNLVNDQHYYTCNSSSTLSHTGTSDIHQNLKNEVNTRVGGVNMHNLSSFHMPNMSNAQDQLKPELKFCQNLTKFQNRPQNTQNEISSSSLWSDVIAAPVRSQHGLNTFLTTNNIYIPPSMSKIQPSNPHKVDPAEHPFRPPEIGSNSNEHPSTSPNIEKLIKLHKTNVKFCCH